LIFVGIKFENLKLYLGLELEFCNFKKE
jgi:hypothetical protein